MILWCGIPLIQVIWKRHLKAFSKKEKLPDKYFITHHETLSQGTRTHALIVLLIIGRCRPWLLLPGQHPRKLRVWSPFQSPPILLCLNTLDIPWASRLSVEMPKSCGFGSKITQVDPLTSQPYAGCISYVHDHFIPTNTLLDMEFDFRYTS